MSLIALKDSANFSFRKIRKEYVHTMEAVDYYKISMISILLTLATVFSQQTYGQTIEPQHGFYILITDAIGNVDSVFLGLDPLGTNEIDPEFDEIDIKDVPFADELDVRIANPVNLDYYENEYFFDDDPTLWHSKKQVYNFDCSNGLLSRYATILVKSSNYPLSFSWDKSYFDDSCFSHSVLNFMNFIFWFDILTFYNNLPPDIFNVYLKDTASYTTINIPFFDTIINKPPEFYVDKNQDTIRLLYLGLFSEKWMLADIQDKYESEWVKVYPNPVKDDIILHFDKEIYPEDLQVILYSITGQVVQELKFDRADYRIDTRRLGLKSGVYFLKIQSINDKLYKILKINIIK